jgi:hypothetical protein
MCAKVLNSCNPNVLEKFPPQRTTLGKCTIYNTMGDINVDVRIYL